MTTIIWVEDAGKIVNPSGIWSSYAKLHNENGPTYYFMMIITHYFIKNIG